jgi:hypothetical protein
MVVFRLQFTRSPTRAAPELLAVKQPGRRQSKWKATALPSMDAT